MHNIYPCLQVSFKKENQLIVYVQNSSTLYTRYLVSEALLPGAEGPEILGGIRHHITAQLHGDPAKLLTASRQVEEHPVSRYIKTMYQDKAHSLVHLTLLRIHIGFLLWDQLP